MSVDDTRLPEKWSRGSAGGPEFRTEVVPMASGAEYRERRWTHPLWRYDIAHNIKTPEQIAELRAFHLARGGAHRGFLLKDWLDFTSAVDGLSTPGIIDQPLGIGDGVETTFQLIKRYPDDVGAYDRPIAWPVHDTLVIGFNDVPQASGFSVARGTGVVTFTAPPGVGVIVTAGFEFDVPVRFEEDWLSVSFDTINSRSAGNVPLVELRS